MQNYRIDFQKGEEDEIMRIIRETSDVKIVGFTDSSVIVRFPGRKADIKFKRLFNQIDRWVYSFRQFYKYTEYQSGVSGN